MYERKHWKLQCNKKFAAAFWVQHGLYVILVRLRQGEVLLKSINLILIVLYSFERTVTSLFPDSLCTAKCS